MRVDGVFTRAGVFVYRNQDGTERRELRPPDEVFRSDALESFALVPVTDDHPPTLVRKDNRKEYEKGYTLEDARRDDDLVVGSLVVTDEALINKMEAGKVGLSCGYEVDLDETPGTHPVYGRYDAVQRNIRGNHLALVHNPRAGQEARVRMDAAYQIEAHGGRDMNEIEKLKAELRAAVEDAGLHKARADKLEADLVAERQRADRHQGAADELASRDATISQLRKDAAEQPRLENELKAMKAKLEETKARLDKAESPERMRAAVKKRVAIEAAAATILDKAARVDGMSDREVMLAVLERTGRDIHEAKERSDEYIQARFDAAVEGYFAGEKALDRIRDRADREVETNKRTDAKSAREAMIRRNRGEEE